MLLVCISGYRRWKFPPAPPRYQSSSDPQLVTCQILMKYFLVLPEENKPLKDLVPHGSVQAEIPIVLRGDDMTFLTGELRSKSGEIDKISTSAAWLSNIFWQFCIPKSHFSMVHFLPLLNSFFLLFRILTKEIVSNEICIY